MTMFVLSTCGLSICALIAILVRIAGGHSGF